MWSKQLSVIIGLHCKCPSAAVESVSHFDQSWINMTSGPLCSSTDSCFLKNYIGFMTLLCLLCRLTACIYGITI